MYYDWDRLDREPCQHCGYDHEDEVEAELARRWHEANDASMGLRYDLDTLKRLP